jgi:hypothetical protein
MKRASNKESTSSGKKQQQDEDFARNMSSMKRTTSQEAGPKGEGRRKRSVDFALEYFTTNDPAESKLLDVLEDSQPSSSMADAASHASAGSRRRRPPHARGHSKLPFLVKQMSHRRHLGQQNHDENENERNNFDTAQAPRTSSNLYASIANDESGNGNGNVAANPPVPRPARIRASSWTKPDMSSARQSSTTRRSSVQVGDLRGPTSELLSNLTENLDGSRDYDFEGPSDEGPSQEMRSPKQRAHRRQRTTTDVLMDHAQHLENLFNAGPTENFSDLHNGFFNRNQSRDGASECSDISEDEEEDRPEDDPEPGIRRPLLGRRQPSSQQLSRLKRAYAYLLALFALIGPQDIWNGIQRFLVEAVLLLMVPMLSLSAILFYYFHNPDLNFLPTEATLSWWLIFAVRQLLTWNLSRASQYILEICTIRTSLTVRLFGPFVALIALQATGWPFLIAAWGGLNVFLTHGVHPFTKNWLYFLNIAMFSREGNPDGGVLESAVYSRILLAMVVLGTAGAAKRTTVALYLSRRMLQYYRPQLQELLTDMKLVMEVAELAAETETAEFTQLVLNEYNNSDIHQSMRSMQGIQRASGPVEHVALKRAATKMMTEQVPAFANKRQPDIAGASSEDDDDLSDDSSEEQDNVPTPLSGRSGKSGRSWRTARSGRSVQASVDGSAVSWKDLKNRAELRRSGSGDVRARSSSPIEMSASAGEIERSHRAKSASNRGLEKLSSQLEGWEEPEEKTTKASCWLLSCD